MGANIITGYTGTRHITPAMDASIYRAIFGGENYVCAEGNLCAGSMPSINQFQILGGLISMQGHAIQVTQETLPVDTCANGYERIDLVCMRFTHDSSTNIDAAQLMVLKGTEVQSPNDPVAPVYNTGVIDQGATIVDMPLYQINLAGSTVTFDKVHERGYTTDQLRPLEITASTVSSLPLQISDSRILEDHKVKPGDCYLGNPSAQTGDWTVTTADGAVTIAGAISGTTDITLWLTIPAV